jgi:ParB family chromosome partitioning protein
MKPQTIPTLQQALSSTLFGSGTTTTPKYGDAVIELDPSELTEITVQPFRAYNSDKLSELADSIRENGQQQPCIVRKKGDKYIILAGRNRKRACEMVGCKVKCIVRECTDAEADLILTDTNLYQRHELLPSELARAYAMQKAAYEAKGERKSTAAIADAYGETVKTVYRYIKLNDLDDSLLPYVDEGRIPVMAGVTLTDTKYLENQKRLADYLDKHVKLKISLKQAEDLLELEEQRNFYSDVLDNFFAGKIELHPTSQAPKSTPTPVKHELSGTLYFCKCGQQIRKSTNADTTGNRLENYRAGHECYGCPYVCSVYTYQKKPDGGFENVISAYECRMSKSLVYNSSIQSFAGDNSNSYISSLDLAFLIRVKEFVETLDDGIVGCDCNAQRGADYMSDGRLRLTITFTKNKKGVAAKKAITDKFFYSDLVRLDMALNDEKQLVLDNLRKACPTAPGLPPLVALTPTPEESKEAPHQEADNGTVNASVEGSSAPNQAVGTGYQRMTHERCNGIKTGYWSPNTKDELIEQLAKYENAYPNGPEGANHEI